MTRDQVRSLWLHRVAAGRVARDPERALHWARRRLEGLLDRDPAGRPWLTQWMEVIDEGPEASMRMMVSIDPVARELRQNSPFVGLLTPSERQRTLLAFESAHPAGQRGGRTLP